MQVDDGGETVIRMKHHLSYECCALLVMRWNMEKYCQRHGRSDWSAANMSFLHKNLDVYGVGCSAQHYYFLFVTNKFDAFSTRESLARARRPGIISQIRVSLSSRAPIPFPISLITSDVLVFQSLPTRIHPMGDQRETHILAIKLLFSLSLFQFHHTRYY